jgi:type VI secretion system protein ImpK
MVRGAVTIVGHTDNQPIKSLRYASNYDLSRERALNVSNVLKRTLDSSMHPAVTGRGPSQPVAEGSDPDSRARNRRVEIIHVR